jgi:hypothetical protein
MVVVETKMENESMHSDRLPKRKKSFRARGSRGGARKKREKDPLVNLTTNFLNFDPLLTTHSDTFRYAQFDRSRKFFIQNEKYHEKNQNESYYTYHDELKENNSSGKYNPKGDFFSCSRFTHGDGIKTSILHNDLNRYHRSQTESTNRMSNISATFTSCEILPEKEDMIHRDENTQESSTFISRFLSCQETVGGIQSSEGTRYEDYVTPELSDQSYFRTSPRSFLMGKKKAKTHAIDETLTLTLTSLITTDE